MGCRWVAGRCRWVAGGLQVGQGLGLEFELQDLRHNRTKSEN